MSEKQTIKITYSTLGTPNPLVDQYYEEALAKAKANLGGTFPMYINGEEVYCEQTFSKLSPIDTSLLIGHFAQASPSDVERAVAAARSAFTSVWRTTPWQERVAGLREVADLISERLFDIAAMLSLEVGKSRLEALGDAQEAADLIRYCCDAMEENSGFSRSLLSESPRYHNQSVLKPYGVWGVISPFNFPRCAIGWSNWCRAGGGQYGCLETSRRSALHQLLHHEMFP